LSPASWHQQTSKQKSRELSAKQDLTLEDIGPVAEMLLPDNAVKDLEDCNLIEECKMTSLIETPITTRDVADERVTAAFYLLASLPKRDPNTRLLSRIAYARLVQAIVELKAVAEAHRHPNYLPCFHSNNTIASETYLKVKARTSNRPLSRGQLSEYARVGQRWNDISSSSKLLITALSSKAETIMLVLQFIGTRDIL
jgi:hypothetical protein